MASSDLRAGGRAAAGPGGREDRENLHLTRQRAALEAAARQLSEHGSAGSLSDDALQTAALELLQSLPSRPEYCCSPGGGPTVDAARGLLFARARSRRIDEHRAEQRAPIVALDELEHVPTSPDSRWVSDDLVDRLAARDWRHAVDAAIPESHRAGWLAWQLKADAGLDAPQIADALRTSPAAVRQRLSRSASWVRLNVAPAEA